MGENRTVYDGEQPGAALAKPEMFLDSSAIVAAQERAQLDVQINTAKAYPRSVSKAKSQVLTLATCDKETAEACFYALPRGGKAIEGPSVRLAEIVAASYQNLRVAARVVSIDATHVTAQGACHDLENNIAASTEVKRRITDKSGRRYPEDMIVVTANAACSIALRNAIFKVVPSGLFRDEFNKIRQCADGDAKTLTETRKALMLYFKSTWKVTEERVLGTIQKHGIEDVTMEDLRVLRGLATALKDGDSTVEEAFPTQNGAATLTPGRHSTKPPTAKPGAKAPEQPADAKPESSPAQPPAEAAEPPTAGADSATGAEPFDKKAAVAEIQKILLSWEKAPDGPAMLEKWSAVLKQNGRTMTNYMRADADTLREILSGTRSIDKGI